MRRLQRVPAGVSFASGHRADHRVLQATEHAMLPLPPELVLPNGRLDLHDDVLKYFQVLFKGTVPHILLGRYVGYIPLNDAWAINVTPRVPVGNMERLMGMVTGYRPVVLARHLRTFSTTTEMPVSLVDLMAEQLLAIFQRIWRDGLVAQYERRERIGSSPAGSVRALDSALLTQRGARPVAVSSSFERTTDFGPNRMLRLGVENLLRRFLSLPPELVSPKRLHELRRTLRGLEHIAPARPSEASPEAVARYLASLPQYHEHYVDALLLAELIIRGQGLAIRDPDGETVFRTILVDMERIFEDYARRLLSGHFGRAGAPRVLDGNLGGPGGAKVPAYETLAAGAKNTDMTPDIVLQDGAATHLVIDAKYKRNQGVPDRPDLNQVLGYSVRYRCPRVMLLYPIRPDGVEPARFVGTVGDTEVYTGHIDLASVDIEEEEKLFCGAIQALFENSTSFKAGSASLQP